MSAGLGKAGRWWYLSMVAPAMVNASYAVSFWVAAGISPAPPSSADLSWRQAC